MTRTQKGQVAGIGNQRSGTTAGETVRQGQHAARHQTGILRRCHFSDFSKATDCAPALCSRTREGVCRLARLPAWRRVGPRLPHRRHAAAAAFRHCQFRHDGD